MSGRGGKTELGLDNQGKREDRPDESHERAAQLDPARLGTRDQKPQQLTKRKTAASLQKPALGNDEENCDPDPDNPRSSIAYSRTASALRTLKDLKTSTESYTPRQQSILQLLFIQGLFRAYSGLIQGLFSVAAMSSAYSRHDFQELPYQTLISAIPALIQ